MTRFLMPAGIFGALAIILFIGVQRAPEKSVIPSALIGKPAPQFELPVLGRGETFSNTSLNGQWYLLNVWGTWCPECINEHDMLLEIARTGVVPMIGLNWKDDDGAAMRWLSELGDPYDIVAVDKEGRVAIDWGVYGAPETFLINDQGLVEYKHVGAMTAAVWREQFFARLPAALTSRTEP